MTCMWYLSWGVLLHTESFVNTYDQTNLMITLECRDVVPMPMLLSCDTLPSARCRFINLQHMQS